jgi:hypothetical protein
VCLQSVDLVPVEVRLPAPLAQAAVDAWNRDDGEGVGEETVEQRLDRRRAAALALIGLSVVNLGQQDGDEVVVPLDPSLISAAVDAAEDQPKR